MLSLYIFAIIAIGCLCFTYSQIERVEPCHPEAIIKSKKLFVVGLIWLVAGAIGFVGASREIFTLAMSGYEPWMTPSTHAEYDLGNMLVLYFSCATISMGAPFVLILGSFNEQNIARKLGLAA